jgi:two-component system alkaline phosphatase synthesis response regulator PhoP
MAMRQRKKKILVAVSNRDICEILSFYLESENYDINIAFSEEEAKKLMPDRELILMDVMSSDVSDFNRVKNILKKAGKIDGISGNLMKFGDLHIDLSSKKVKTGDSVILLTKTEFEILFMLASNPLKVHSHRQIANTVWKNSAYVTMHTVNVHIARLRKKLGSKAYCISNRPGFGYEFNPPQPEETS